MRHVSDEGLALIRHFEGYQPLAYRCPGGYDTIGYGHVLRPGEAYPAGVTQAEAEHLLRGDVEAAERAVERLIAVPLAPGQFDALVSFTFNLGAGALQRSTLRLRILRGDHESAAAEFLRWIYSGGRPLKGLLRRRMAESSLYAGRQWS